MTEIIQQLLDFARPRPLKKADVEVNTLVRETVNMLAPLAGKEEIGIQVTPSSGPSLANLDAGQIQQVFTNLLVNAVQAMPEGGSIDLKVSEKRVSSPDGSDVAEYVSVTVRDEGQGISAEDLPHLFEPFFTTKQVGEGSGLGLSIAYGLVRDHGGWIEVQSDPGRGSVFTVYLPGVKQ